MDLDKTAALVGCSQPVHVPMVVARRKLVNAWEGQHVLTLATPRREHILAFLEDNNTVKLDISASTTSEEVWTEKRAREYPFSSPQIAGLQQVPGQNSRNVPANR